MHRMQIVLYIRVCIRIRRHVMTTTTTRRMFVVYVHTFGLLRSHATFCLRIHIFVANSRYLSNRWSHCLWLTAVTSCDHSTTADGRRRIDAASLPRSRLSVPHCYSSRLSLHCSSRRLSVSFLLVAHSRLPSPFHLVAHSRVCVAPKPDGNSPQMNPCRGLRQAWKVVCLSP